MRLDHLLSKEKGEVGAALLLRCQGSEFIFPVVSVQDTLPLGKETSSYFRWRCARRVTIGGRDNFIFPVAMRLGETPVPIPNTMVKTQAADGTMLETIWESRWLPDNIYMYGRIKADGHIRGCSSAGRAPALQAGGQEFESLHLQSRESGGKGSSD